jgi:hypothetical protein
MTIRKFNEWGVVITRPATIELCDSDAAVAEIVNHCRRHGTPIPHIRLTGGSLAAALGNSPTLSESTVHELPIDVLHVRYSTIDHIQYQSVASNSVIMRNKWWLGQVVAVANGGYLGRWEIAPRAHPNDGVFDVVEVAANMSCRHRLIAKRRLPLGTHLPHPSIHQRQSRSDMWNFSTPIGLYLDEKFVGRTTQVHVTIEPDALKLVK